MKQRLTSVLTDPEYVRRREQLHAALVADETHLF
jgi:hypothetical protein